MDKLNSKNQDYRSALKGRILVMLKWALQNLVNDDCPLKRSDLKKAGRNYYTAGPHLRDT